MNRSKLKRFWKKCKRNPKIEQVVAWLLSIVMKFCYCTTRWTFIGMEIPDSYHKAGKPLLVNLWHDRLMLAPCFWRWKPPLHVLASKHSDGRLIAKVVAYFNMPAIYGSTGSGIAAAKELVKLIKKGNYVAIIPDGPRGPRHKLAPGAIAISRLSKVDIMPFSFCVKRFMRTKSWDKFIIAWPFNRGVIVCGEPIKWQDLKQMDEDEARAYVESKINECSQRAYKVLCDQTI